MSSDDATNTCSYHMAGGLPAAAITSAAPSDRRRASTAGTRSD